MTVHYDTHHFLIGCLSFTLTQYLILANLGPLLLALESLAHWKLNPTSEGNTCDSKSP